MSPPRPFVVGLTGGIASGKTAVAQLFEQLGVPVIDTDQLAREVVAPGHPGLEALVQAFGAELLHADGSLNRGMLRRIIFEEPAARRQVEALLHPRIAALAEERVADAGGPYVILAIPLLVETDFHGVDRVLVVDVDPATQRRRLMDRDGIGPDAANTILRAQAGREARLERADDVIDNRGARSRLKPQVAALHRKYLKLAEAGSTRG